MMFILGNAKIFQHSNKTRLKQYAIFAPCCFLAKYFQMFVGFLYVLFWQAGPALPVGRNPVLVYTHIKIVFGENPKTILMYILFNNLKDHFLLAFYNLKL